MNSIVGKRKARAASPSPRRFMRVMTARNPRQSGTVAERQAREGRRQCADSGRNGDGDGERVVDDQGRARDEAGTRSRLARDTA